MRIELTPLVKPLMVDNTGDFSVEHGQSMYFTPGMYFSITKEASGEWLIASTEWLQLDHPRLATTYINTGIEDARFERRKDALAALQSFFEGVS